MFDLVVSFESDRNLSFWIWSFSFYI